MNISVRAKHLYLASYSVGTIFFKRKSTIYLVATSSRTTSTLISKMRTEEVNGTFDTLQNKAK